jgi:hypothetical protein
MVDSAVAPVAKTRPPRMALRNYFHMLGKSDAELAQVDPVQMNLLVAKSSVMSNRRSSPSFQEDTDVSG